MVNKTLATPAKKGGESPRTEKEKNGTRDELVRRLRSFVDIRCPHYVLGL
jgi:hypothetical protein